MAQQHDRGLLDGILKTSLITALELILAAKVGTPVLGGTVVITKADIANESVTAVVGDKVEVTVSRVGAKKVTKKKK